MKQITKKILITLFVACIAPQTLLAQECMLGEVKWFAGNFAPRTWAFAHGQLLPISQNSALFSILGTIYGGDGETTFALPDLRGRTAVGTGSGPGLTPNRREGQKFGSETNTLTVQNLPPHSHSLHANKAHAVKSDPAGQLLSKSGNYRPSHHRNETTTLASNSIGNTGGGQAVNNLQPSLVMNPIICLQGIYPSPS